jgi:glutamate racemase
MAYTATGFPALSNSVCAPTMRDIRPVLVFDSGVGGLSVLAEIRTALPHAPLVYAADNAWHPYGTREEHEIAARVPALLGRLAERYRPRLIVIACNTAATIALADVRAALELPIVGTVPAIKPAALASKNRVIGVLGTAATIRQPYVDRLIAEFAPDCTVLRLGSAELVAMAEAKLRGTEPLPGAVSAVMAGLYQQAGGERIDQLVLACTHFPLLADEIAAASPPGVTMVDSGKGIARRTAFLTQDQDWPDAPKPGVAVFTRSDADLQLLRPALSGYGVASIEAL